jgi:hypothetical protein
MKQEQAIQQLNDSGWRKYLLKKGILHILGDLAAQEASHAALADQLGLDSNRVKGGLLEVRGNKFKHVRNSTTVKSASQSDLDKFHGGS